MDENEVFECLDSAKVNDTMKRKACAAAEHKNTKDEADAYLKFLEK